MNVFSTQSRRCGFLILALLLCGCVSAEAEKNVPEPAVPRADELALLRDHSAQFVRAFAASLQKNDFSFWEKALAAELPPGSKTVVSAAQFRHMAEQLQRKYGELSGISRLGELNQGRVLDDLWKFSFEKKYAGGVQKSEELFAVRGAILKGKPVIAGFGFRFFNASAGKPAGGK